MDDNENRFFPQLVESRSVWEHRSMDSVLRHFKDKSWEEIDNITQVVYGLGPLQYTQERGTYEMGYIRIESREDSNIPPQLVCNTEIWVWDAIDAPLAKRVFLKLLDGAFSEKTQKLVIDARDEVVTYEGREAIERFFDKSVKLSKLKKDPTYYGEGITLRP